MTDKQINTCEFLNICQTDCNGTLEDTEVCHCYELYKQLERKEKELQEAMDNYVQLDLQRVKEYNELVDLYKAKEQECEDLKSVRNMWMSKYEQEMKTSEFFQDVLAEVKADNEELKEEIKHYKQIAQYHGNLSVKYTNKSAKLKQTLTEIKKVLQLYSDGKIGTDKGNGIFEFEVSSDNGKLIYCYDTNPAKRALQKISECEADND